MERLFLEHTYRWLKLAGVLVLVIPGNRLSECVDILAVHFRDKAIYRLSEPESVHYNQIVTFGVRRSRREREQLKDWDVQRAKTKLMGFARNYDESRCCRTRLIGNSLYRRVDQHNSLTADFPWTRWRMCCRRRLYIHRRDESCFHPKCGQQGGP